MNCNQLSNWSNSNWANSNNNWANSNWSNSNNNQLNSNTINWSSFFRSFETINDVMNELYKSQPNIVRNLKNIYKDDNKYQGVTYFDYKYEKQFYHIIMSYNCNPDKYYNISWQKQQCNSGCCYMLYITKK